MKYYLVFCLGLLVCLLVVLIVFLFSMPSVKTTKINQSEVKSLYYKNCMDAYRLSQVDCRNNAYKYGDN